MSEPERSEVTPPHPAPWHEFANGPVRGTVFRGDVYATISVFESDENPGFYHLLMIDMTGCCETKRPVNSLGVEYTLTSWLKPLGLRADDLSWQSEILPANLPKRQEPARRQKRVTGEIVYFLKAGDFIKIGKATGSPDSRVASLKTGCPFPIDVLGFMPGGLDDERRLHVRFAHLRAHGEWFHATPEICDHIAGLTDAA